MQPRTSRLLATWIAVMLVSSVGAADRPESTDWTAVGASGPVHGRAAYARSHQWTRVRTGDRLAPLTAVRTGSRGGATIVAPARTLVVGPDTEVELPALAAGDRTAEALQDRGTIDYEIAGASASGLDVVTPFLVAATDGATFRVTTASGTTVVDVFDGTVVVTSRLDGTSATLAAGEGATVDAEATAGLDLRPAGGDAVAQRR